MSTQIVVEAKRWLLYGLGIKLGLDDSDQGSGCAPAGEETHWEDVSEVAPWKSDFCGD